MNKRILSSLKSNFKRHYVMPEEAKKQMALRNNKKLFILQLIIMPIVIFATIITYAITKTPIEGFSFVYFNNITVIIGGLITIPFCVHTQRHPNTKSSFQMIPVHITFTYMYFLLGMIFYSGYSPINSFLIYATICIITPLYFDIDPIFFSLLQLSLTVAVSIQTIGDPSIGLAPTIDIYIFGILTIILSFNKWKNAKSDFQYKRTQTEYKDRVEKELSLAALVQSSFFKHEEQIYEDWTIGYYTKAMSGVSGDFIDIYNNGNKLEGIGIFDVSGHGIASGLVTMLVKNIIINEFQKGKSDKLKTVIDRINVRYLNEKGNIENYLTGVLCRINNDHVDFVNAGHSMPILYKHNEEHCIEIKNENSERAYGAIGLLGMPSNFVQHEVTMESGDELILFTDGITDTSNETKEAFGRDRLIRSINRNADRPLTTQINCIISDVTNYAHGLPLEDDITMLVLKKK